MLANSHTSKAALIVPHGDGHKNRERVRIQHSSCGFQHAEDIKQTEALCLFTLSTSRAAGTQSHNPPVQACEFLRQITASAQLELQLTHIHGLTPQRFVFLNVCHLYVQVGSPDWLLSETLPSCITYASRFFENTQRGHSILKG